IPAGNVGNDRARNQRLFDDAGLVIRRKPATPPRSRDHFQPANRRRLRLKYMVKRRHKPISDSGEEISTIAPRKPQKQGAATTPLTVEETSFPVLITLAGEQ